MRRIALLCALLVRPLLAAETPEELVDKLLDRIVEHERAFLDTMQTRAPLIETYIQETLKPSEAGARPTKDHYFLGRFRLAGAVNYETLIERTDPPLVKTGFRLLPRAAAPPAQPLSFLPRGFAQMAVMDLRDFNRQTYSFEYVRREFLGEVRCLVFDVAPLNRVQPGKFVGRIWVEDRGNAIVRFNGTYVPMPVRKGTNPELYFHFDSW